MQSVFLFSPLSIVVFVVIASFTAAIAVVIVVVIVIRYRIYSAVCRLYTPCILDIHKCSSSAQHILSIKLPFQPVKVDVANGQEQNHVLMCPFQPL